MSTEQERAEFEIGDSVFVILRNDPSLCKSFDSDCFEMVAIGGHFRCAAGLMAHGIVIPSEGKCPFVGD